MTYAYVSFLSQWAKLLSWTDVAKSFHTTWDKVSYAVIAMVNYGLAHRSMTGISAIGIDEVQWKKGQNYLTVVYQINQGCRRLLWVGVDRTMASFEGFFRTIGPDVASKIEFACTDMWKPYLTLLKKHCPLALNVLDKFHIMAKINEAIDKTRRMETAKFKKAGLDLLHNLRWCVLKRPENLTAKQKKRLNGALHGNLTCNSQTIRAYVLAQMFQVFWTYSSPTWASKYLDKWTNTVMRSRIEPMKKVAKTIRTHKELILNYFKAKKEFSSGVVEGLNNNVKVAMRNARGYRSFAVAEAALYHRMGKLPEPHQFHAFY
jgi:transposase